MEVYRHAFNVYDADPPPSMLEENYRANEEDLIRRDIGRMKLATPVDTRRLKMAFRRIEEQWRIVFSDEVE